jgi:hypothetical protein
MREVTSCLTTSFALCMGAMMGSGAGFTPAQPVSITHASTATTAQVSTGFIMTLFLV